MPFKRSKVSKVLSKLALILSYLPVFLLIDTPASAVRDTTGLTNFVPFVPTFSATSPANLAILVPLVVSLKTLKPAPAGIRASITPAVIPVPPVFKSSTKASFVAWAIPLQPISRIPVYNLMVSSINLRSLILLPIDLDNFNISKGP